MGIILQIKLQIKWLQNIKNFGIEERIAKALDKNLTPIQVSVLASIVHKETAKADERPTSSWSLSKSIKNGMPLQADPTVIFAMKKESGDFDQVIKRVYHKDIKE